MRTWFVFLVLFTCWLCPQQQCNADEHQQIADSFVQSGNPSKPAPPAELTPGVSPKQVEPSQEENGAYSQKPQTDWCKVAIKAVVSNWPLIIIYIVGTCAAIKTFRAFVIQIKEMNRQTVAMRTAAEAALQSAEAVRNSERAWILIERTSPQNRDIRGDSIPAFGLRFKVFGKTPAKIIEAAFSYTTIAATAERPNRRPDLPSPPQYSNPVNSETMPELGSVLPPLRRFDFLVVYDGVRLSWQDYGMIVDQDRFLCCYGIVKYIDAFDRTKTRETRFCYVYSAPSRGILRSEMTQEELRPSDFRIGGPPEYNEAT
jgi:hypothetical protein